MKAVSVLLCLALAHGISASIFRDRDLRIDGLDDLQQAFINEHRQQHRNQPSESKRSHFQYVKQQHEPKHTQDNSQYRDQSHEEERSQEYKLHRPQHQQQRDEQRDEQREQHYHHEQKHQHVQQRVEERDQEQVQRYNMQEQDQVQQWNKQQNLNSKESVYQMPNKYQPHHQKNYRHIPSLSSAQDEDQEKEQYPIHKHGKYVHHKEQTRRHEDSYPSDSSRSSQESKEIKQYKDDSTSSENQKWTPTYSSVVNEAYQMAPVFANAINWDELQEVVSNTPVHVMVNKENKNEDIETLIAHAQNAMKHISEDEKAKFQEAYDLAKEHKIEDAELNATELAQKYHYTVEEHTIKTADGYMLTLFRIPPKKSNIRDVQKKPVVFLMHGILGSADDWLLMGPGQSLAYLLADAGYDVWLGNARGNKYSSRHVSKHRAMPDFWQFSNDEIALQDLPSMIDYALQTTNQEKLYYIGHSQGATTFFALASTRPEYNDKIIMMYALSPMVYMENVRSPLFRYIASTSNTHDRLEKQLGNGVFVPTKEMIKAVGGAMLENEIGVEKVASHVNFVMAGINVDSLKPEIVAVMMSHLPAGTSTKVIKQYGQSVASHKFRRYDYGANINLKVYGTEQPPKYDMKKVYAPVTLFYSEGDWLAQPQDVERLEKELPNVRNTFKVSDPHFSHMDFEYSYKAPEMVYRTLMESMEKSQ